MVKDLEQYSEEQKLTMFLQGLGIAVYEIQEDVHYYYSYKNGTLEKVPSEKEVDMMVLSLLEQLGYPMDEEGTYLYKNMIVKVINFLDNISSNQEITNLISQLNSKFSQFYVDVARNDLDMGIKTFHKYVESSVSKVDYSKADSNLIFQIFGNTIEDKSYSENAFTIGFYLSENLRFKKSEVTKIKKIFI